MTPERRSEALKGLSEALQRLRLASPTSADSPYRDAFSRIDERKPTLRASGWGW
jgi:hypothetical protein